MKVFLQPFEEALKLDSNNVTLKAMPQLANVHENITTLRKGVSYAYQLFSSDTCISKGACISKCHSLKNTAVTLQQYRSFYQCLFSPASSSKYFTNKYFAYAALLYPYLHAFANSL